MNIEVRQPAVAQKTRLKFIDVDIHPKSSIEDLRPYLSDRWWTHLQTYGTRQRQGFLKGFAYPKSQPQASRRDSWPPGGGLPGSDLKFMKQQFLDFYPIEYAIMNPLSPTGQGDQNEEFSAAMAFAANEFQIEGWYRKDQRLLASVVVPYEDAEASRIEIRRRAGGTSRTEIRKNGKVPREGGPPGVLVCVARAMQSIFRSPEWPGRRPP